MMGKEAVDAFTAERVAENPVRRFGTPEEVARAAVLLAFEATCTTGVEFAVDGGITQL